MYTSTGKRSPDFSERTAYNNGLYYFSKFYASTVRVRTWCNVRYKVYTTRRLQLYRHNMSTYPHDMHNR